MKKKAPLSRSGRFAAEPNQAAAEFTESISFDRRLWRHDIQGSIAHATMLERAGLISKAERNEIVAGLEAIADEIQKGVFQWDAALEDVHMNIEAALTRRTAAGAKLHTGRSRNDQVALDLRLWLRDEMIAWREELRELQRALTRAAEKTAGVWIPGYTHLQRAQPVSMAHHLLAYAEMFDRDAERAGHALERMNVSPLGSGALAGSSLPLDREFAAKLLGFTDARGRARISQNSMDAVSDRDFAIEFCAAAALAAMHLSRLGEDLILWASAEFHFVEMPDAFTTGSSLMPQKKNPDVAELTRGKTGRVYGNLMALLTLMKGLPLAYNRDLQEDKEPLFDTADTIRACVRIMAALIAHLEADEARCRAASSDPALLATDLADFLARDGVPFRQAHHAVGAAVALAEKLGKDLAQLTEAECAEVHPKLAAGISAALNLPAAMQGRRLVGSPGPTRLRQQIRRWQKRLTAAQPAGKRR